MNGIWAYPVRTLAIPELLGIQTVEVPLIADVGPDTEFSSNQDTAITATGSI